MEWNDSNVLSFIEAIREKPIIWDPQNTSKKNKAKRGDAFRELAEAFPLATTEELIQKWKNLTQTYRNLRRKVLASKKSGSGIRDIYKPTWFASATMDTFISDTYTPQHSGDAVSTR